MRAELLDARVVAKRYDGRTVLDNVDLSIGRGEIVSLVGPSGCGKSTLLRIIAGLDRAFEGEVTLAGQPLREPSERVGVMFQEPRLLPWLRVEDNVRFIAGTGANDGGRARRLIDEVGLEGHEKAWPKQLSGGMAQRVALARGLYTQPDLLVLDEPFSAVDALARMRLQSLLLSVASAHGTAVLIVTHDLDEALYLSDRVYLMGAHPGRIVETIDIGLDRPRDRNDPLLVQQRRKLLGLLDGSDTATTAHASASEWSVAASLHRVT